MELKLKMELAQNYHGNTQIARVLTETWIADNMFCPRCGNMQIRQQLQLLRDKGFVEFLGNGKYRKIL